MSSCRNYFFDEIKKRDIELHMIVGNHDTFFKNTNDVNSPRLLLKDYEFNVIDSPSELEFDDGSKIFMMPWICTDNYNQSMEAIKTTNAQVLFGHFEIAGFQMYKGHENDEGFDPKIFEKFDLVCSGHFHHRSSKGNITYLGNPYEMTWADYDDARGFHIFDTSARSLEFIQNPFTIFSKIYYDDEKVDPRSVDVSQYANQHIKLIVVNKKDYYKYDQFIDRLYKINPLELKIIEDLSEFEADAMGDQEVDLEDTVTLLSQYVDNLETEADKERIKTLMKTLYVEAQNYEEV